MGRGHAHALYVEGTSPLHRIRPQCKLAATVLFVLAVVATPREAFWAYGAHAGIVAGAALLARVPLPFVLRRLVIEVPFVLFALFLPFLGQGPRVDVLGVSLSVEGLWAAWNILVKATIGLSATIVLAATTPVAEILHGLEHLRIPKAFTAVAAFMVRYADVIAGEMQRMRVARLSRGHDARWMWQARAVASSAGALFIRSFERGERVYLAMLSRGYEGSLPIFHEGAATPAQWAASLSVPALAAVVSAAAWAVAG